MSTRPINLSPERFFNRELSWLDFNKRVLEEADNSAHPLLERVRFLSISASNLDEFYMVRYAGLREQVRVGYTRPSQDGLTPQEQVARIETIAGDLMVAQQAIWAKLRTELLKEHIELVGSDDLSETDKAWLKTHFEDHIFPLLTPLAVDEAQPFPFIPNRGLAVALDLEAGTSDETKLGLVLLPIATPRYIRLPDQTGSGIRFIALESIVDLYVPVLFPGFASRGRCLFRVLRDSDIEIDDEAEDLIEQFEILLRRRRRGRIVRIKLDQASPQVLQDLIALALEAEPRDIVPVEGVIGLAQLAELIAPDRPDLQFPLYEPRYPERIREHGGDCFAAIREKDILVHHPFETFDVVVEFLRQAASDPDVIAIKQTLYRTSSDSPIVAALIQAAEEGKNVTALVEIKARFDEEANLRLARDLERAGVQVVYGFPEYKTHAKISLVMRREDDRLVRYAHYGTGNYHPITARIYTDLSLFTADEALCRDAGRVFNYVTAHSAPPVDGPALEKISMSPLTLKPNLLDLIAAETKNCQAGKPSGIWAKLNSLVDGGIIDALYAASQAGVAINLVVRGICCLRPGVSGLSETIRVKSIVGRFLEHSRIACFANGKELPSDQAKVFISSADWMPRNLKGRVEAFVPVENETVHRQVLNQIMLANLNDDVQSWELHADGSYQRVQPAKDMDGFSAHDYFMDNSSLSGRGHSLELTMPPRLAHNGRSKDGTS